MPSNNSGSNPSRVILQINQAAKLLNVSKDTLRRWEREGKISSSRTSGGYRIYDITDLLTQVKSSKLRNLITSKYPELKPLTQISPETAAKKLLKISQAAQTLGVSKDTLRRWEKTGKVSASRTDSGYRVYDVTKLLETQKPKIKKTTFKIYQDDIKSITATPSSIQVPNIALTDTVGRALEKDFIPSPHFSPEVSSSAFESASKFKNLFYSQLVNIFAVILLTLPGLLLLNYIKSNINTTNPLLSLTNSKPVKTVTFASDLLDTFSPSLSYRILGNHPPGSPPGYLTQKLNNTLSPAQKRDLGYLNGGKKSGSNGSVLAESSPSGSFLQINVDTQINGSLKVNTGEVKGGVTSESINTGFGDNEVYPMDQPLLIASTPSFASLTFTSGTNQIKLSNTTISTQTGGSGAYIASIPTLSANDDFVFAALAQTLTNKTISGSSNTFSNIPTSALSSSSITISAGSGLSGGGSVSLGSSVTISNSGVTSITGTANQVIASAGTGGVTLSLPQDIDTGADVDFGTLTLADYLTLTQTTAPAPTTDNLYNVSGDLYWNGTNITAGGALPVGTSGQTLRHNGTSWTANSVLYNDGTNIGIGNTSPGSKLHVTGGITSSSTLSNTTAGSAALSYETTYARLMAVGADVFTNGMLRIISSASDGSNQLTLIASDANGNVGIGVTGPGAKFEVGNGTDSLQVSSVGDLTFVDADGAAGITGPAGGALTINSTGAQALNLDSGTTGTVNLATGNNAKTINIATGTAGYTINMMTDNTTPDALNIGSNADTTILNGTIRIMSVSVSSPLYTDSSRNITTTAPTSGAIGYWTRTGTVLTTTTSGDSLSLGSTVTMADDQWVGLGSSAGLIEFDDQTVDEVNILNANVGIGTTAPSVKLNIDGAQGTRIRVQNSDGSRGLDLIANGAAGAGVASVNTTSSGYGLTFGIDSIEKMRISTGGNVGIGTTAPESLFHMLGTTDPNMLLVDSVGTVASNVTGRRANGTVGTKTGVVADDNLLVLDGNGYTSASSYTTNFPVRINMQAAGTWSGTSTPSQITFSTTPASSTTIAERMRIDSTGNVGIGTTAPTAPLELWYNTATSTNHGIQLINRNTTAGRTADITLGVYDGANYLRSKIVHHSDSPYDWNNQRLSFYVQTTGSDTYTTVMSLTSTGNVGIGTTAPAQIFEINKSQNGQTKALISNTNVGGNAFAGLNLTSDGGSFEIYRTSNAYGSTAHQDDTLLQDSGGGDIVMYGASEIARFANGGNVGIGTSVPGGKLIVSGGNVGIGVTNPDRLLRVQGDTGAVASNLGQIAISTATDANRRLEIGRDYTNNIGFVQAVTHGTGYVPLILQYNGGNVGIGTTVAPPQKLSVRSDDNTESTNIAGYYANNLSVGIGIGYYNVRQITAGQPIYINAGTTGVSYVGNQSTGGVYLAQGGGNVAIGNITPVTRLDVNGGINLQTSAEYSDTATGSRIVSSPNLHMDSANGATAIYLNYFGGTSGINFCNGSASCPAGINSAGTYTTSGHVNIGSSSLYYVNSVPVLGVGSYTNLYANGGGYIQLLTQASGHIAYMGQATFRTYAPIYPGQYPSGGDQASWPLYSHSSYGLYTTTGFGITGTLYMGGSSTATVLNTNQLWCNNASPCYFNQAGTGATYLGNAAGTIAYLNTQSTLGTCNSVGGAPAYAYLYDCSSTPSDYAEGYGTPQGSEPGDIMVLTDEAHILTQSTRSYQDQILGVVSTDPNDFLGQTIAKDRNPQPVGLAGRLPVKVSLENGPIRKGDLLTSSSTPGVAMKANKGGITIGMALEDYDGSVRISRETLLQEHNRTTDHPDLPEFHSDPSRWPAGVGKISFLARVQYANPGESLANLLIDDQGYLAGSTVGNLKQITLNADLNVTGKISASDFALDAAKLNSTGSLASVPVSEDNKVTISDAINTIDDRLSSIQNKQASQSAELAQARILGEQAVAQAESLDEKVASTSANIASLSSQINTLLGISSNDNLDLTPPSAISSTDSATISRLEVTDTLSTLNLDATDATVSSSLKSLGHTFLGETTVAGDISIDGAFSIKEGKSLNSLPILYLQDNPLAEKIDIFNGLITLDKTGLLKAQKLAVSDKSLGSVIIPAGQTSVSISTTGLTEKSKVFVSTEKPVSIGANSKNASSHTFKIEISSALPDDLAVDWWIVDSE